MALELVTRIGLLLLFAAIVLFTFEVGTLLACLSTGVKFTRVAIFYGKPVFTIQTRLAPIDIGFIPLGGSVRLDMNDFPAKPLFKRCFVILVGPAALFLSSIACLGFLYTGQSFTAAFPEFVGVLVSPVSRGHELIRLFFEKLQSSPIAGYGIIAAKISACSLLPLPTTAGGGFLIEVTKGRAAGLVAKMLNYVGRVFLAVVLIDILITTVHFLLAMK